MTRLPLRKKATLLAATFALLAPSTVLAMGDKPTPQQEALKLRCDALTKETGEPHFYGEGRIVSLVEGVSLPEKMTTDGAGTLKVYIAKFNTSSFSFERTYVRATNARWEKLEPLQEDRNYAFCYTVERQRHAAINHPETMLLLEE